MGSDGRRPFRRAATPTAATLHSHVAGLANWTCPSYCGSSDQGTDLLHLRNLRSRLPTASLKRMALRALLFSSDGTSTSTLCQVLTELGIEAEICPEMLVAVQRISQESYDAILVDWDQESDAIPLLKAAREQKTTSQALNLALVQNDKDLPRALQHGANSAIRKPIDPRQAKDTLSTARDLILSRRSEQKTKEERAAAAQAAIAAAAAEVPVDNEAPPPPKTGFLAQTATRSAFEAAESTEPQG